MNNNDINKQRLIDALLSSSGGKAEPRQHKPRR